jgi:aspartate aminotransferase-like enzyme
MGHKYTLNMSCGQTDIYPAALEAMARQLHSPIYYLPYFEEEKACLDALRKMLYTRNDVLLVVGTATYGEEASLLSALEPGDHVLTVNTGVFGQVVTDLVRVVEAVPTEIKLRGGLSVSPDQIRQALKKDPSIKMVGVVHSETSRGTLNPVKEIGLMLKAEFPNVLYWVDSVSGLASAELKTDEWGIDILCTSSQKCVNAPQGVAIVVVSPKAWKAMETRKTPIRGLCLDLLYWRRYHKGVLAEIAAWKGLDGDHQVDVSMGDYKAAHGPSESYVLVKALRAAAEEILEEGMDNVIERHKVASKALRYGIRAMGLQTLSTEGNAAPGSTAIALPTDKFDVKRFMRTMWEEYGIATAGGSPDVAQQDYAGVRIGTMGMAASAEYVYPVLAALEELLPRFGFAVKRGAALPAAQAVFAAGE